MSRKFTHIVAIVLMSLFIISGCSHEHILKEEEIKPATCDEYGTIKKYCTECNYSVEEVIPSLGHDYILESVEKEATCTEDGIDIYKCINCGTTESRVSYAHHSYSGRVCTVCGYIEPLPELTVGMTKNEVRSKWGEPLQIDKSTSSRGTTETWWYIDNGRKIAVTFDVDGKVWSINYI